MGLFDKEIKKIKNKVDPKPKRSGYGGKPVVVEIDGKRQTFTGSNSAFNAQKAATKAKNEGRRVVFHG